MQAVRFALYARFLNFPISHAVGTQLEESTAKENESHRKARQELEDQLAQAEKKHRQELERATVDLAFRVCLPALALTTHD